MSENKENWFNKNIHYIIIGMFLFLFMNQCGTDGNISELDKNTSSEIDSLTTEIETLNVRISKMITITKMEKIQEDFMYRFLIYEEDIDKGRMSLSQLKEKLKELQDARREEK